MCRSWRYASSGGIGDETTEDASRRESKANMVVGWHCCLVRVFFELMASNKVLKLADIKQPILKSTRTIVPA